VEQQMIIVDGDGPLVAVGDGVVVVFVRSGFR